MMWVFSQIRISSIPRIVSIFSFLLLVGFVVSCSDPVSEMKLVLDRYDKINENYFSSMKELHKDGSLDPNVFFGTLRLINDRCEKVRALDLKRTPSDFQQAFNNVAYNGCDTKTLADMTTYEGDPKVAQFKEAAKSLESVCSKYGFAYKHSSNPKK